MPVSVVENWFYLLSNFTKVLALLKSISIIEEYYENQTEEETYCYLFYIWPSNIYE